MLGQLVLKTGPFKFVMSLQIYKLNSYLSEYQLAILYTNVMVGFCPKYNFTKYKPHIINRAWA